MLCRLLTEDGPNYRTRVRGIMTDLFPSGFTLLKGEGCWQGNSERSIIAEVAGDDPLLSSLIHTAAERIGKANGQDAVLVQMIECSTTFVSTKGG